MAEGDAATTAQAIADRLVQQSSGEEFPAGSAPEETPEGEDTLAAANNNKRPREDEVEDDAEEQEQMRKRASFTTPEVAEVRTRGVLCVLTSSLCFMLVLELLGLKIQGAETRQSGFSDAPASYSAAPSVAPQANGSEVAAAAAAAAAVAAAAVASAPTMGDAFGPKTATLQIPATLVGKVIGKGGETIKNLQNQSRTRIQIDHTAPGDTKTITITSENPDYLEAAKHLIQQVVSDDSPQGEVQRSVECPPGIVGRIIGRGGETIRALQQASQAYIVVDQNFPEGHPRKVNISGRADAVERASRMVTELIQGEPGSATAIIQKVCAVLKFASVLIQDLPACPAKACFVCCLSALQQLCHVCSMGLVLPAIWTVPKRWLAVSLAKVVKLSRPCRESSKPIFRLTRPVFP